MVSLLTPIAALPGLRPEFVEKFHALGLITLQDALRYWPFRHQDWRQVTAITDVTDGQTVTLQATIVTINTRRAWHRKLNLTEATVTDHSQAKLKVVWFNRPYLASWFKPGAAVFLSGTVVAGKNNRLELRNPNIERPTATPTHVKLVPVYPSIAGLSQWQIRKVMKQAVALGHLVPDPLPNDIRQSFGFLDLAEALRQIHFPDGPDQAKAALDRLKFNELLAWQLQWQQALARQHRQPAIVLPFREAEVRTFVQHLPFELTNDQRVAAWQVFQDLGQTRPMSRLVQGDVGSGKTVIAALAAFDVARNHTQVALLAPTVVLAEQHWQSFRLFFAKTEIRLALITGSSAASQPEIGHDRSEITKAIAAGEIDVVIGTHALLQGSITWSKLGLVIVDEQQRFGVQQRQALLDEQLLRQETVPHFLSLTATPIPRTLALFLTGDLSVSLIHQKPPGRTPITTDVVGPTERPVIDQAITETVARQEQAYVITPLIEESDTLGVRAATVEFERLQKKWPGYRIGLIHGSLPANQRVARLEAFRQHELDILVSTTVIEVGVDVPNATLMIIEGAERFGLAQLHQLRGRVGRGLKPSRCLLATDQVSPSILQRLAAVAATDDGFALAELDLQQRGAGDVYGLQQSGLPDWRLATVTDVKLMEQARQAASHLLKQQQLTPELIAGLNLRPVESIHWE